MTRYQTICRNCGREIEIISYLNGLFWQHFGDTNNYPNYCDSNFTTVAEPVPCVPKPISKPPLRNRFECLEV